LLRQRERMKVATVMAAVEVVRMASRAVMWSASGESVLATR
jgi:hypothetical protein